MISVIQGFADKETEKVFRLEHSKKLPANIQQRAYVRLLMIDAANRVEDLQLPPSNRLHVLGGDRKGEWSVSVNDQWRITFIWGKEGPENVKIENYHR